MVLLFNFVIAPALTGRSLFKDKPATGELKLEEEETAEVTAAEPRAELLGLRIDANALNLDSAGTGLSVKQYAPEVGEDGFYGQTFDIELGDSHYLQAPLTVTLPYEASRAEEAMPLVLHFDRDVEAWIPQVSVTDSAAGTVTASLTSLSPVRLVYFSKSLSDSLFYIKDADSIHARLAVSYNYWTLIRNTSLEPAQIVAQDFLANGNVTATTGQILANYDGAINALSDYYNLFGNLGEAILGALGNRSDAVKLVTDKAAHSIGLLSLFITAGQLGYDLATKDSTGPRNETAINLYKNILTDSGTIYSLASGYSSAALSLSFFGVALIGLGLDYAVKGAQTIQADTVKAVYDTYYREHSSFDEEDWYKLFVDAYWRAWQNNRGSKEGMEQALAQLGAAIDAHAETFWKDIYRDGSDALTFAVAESGRNNYFTPAAGQKTELTERFKADMYQRFNEKAMPWINAFMQERVQDSIYSSLLQAAEPYNRYYRIQMQEIVPEDSDEESRFQTCPIRFGTADSLVSTPYPEQWQLLAPEGKREWALRHDVTLLGYLMAGSPDRVYLFDPFDEDIRLSGAIESRSFQLQGEGKEYLTLIDLSGQSTADYVWALTSIEANKQLGSLSGGTVSQYNIYDVEVTLSVSASELSIQCSKETISGKQTAAATLRYPTVFEPGLEGSLHFEATMQENSFVDRDGDYVAFAYVEYQDPLGYKVAATREPGSVKEFVMSPLPPPGERVPAGMTVRYGAEEHVLEAGIGIADGMGIPPEYAVILTYTWMPAKEAAQTTPRFGN